MMQRIPKRRGHNKNRARGVRADREVRSVTLGMLSRNFAEGAGITPEVLVSKRLIPPRGRKSAGGEDCRTRRNNRTGEGAGMRGVGTGEGEDRDRGRYGTVSICSDQSEYFSRTRCC